MDVLEFLEKEWVKPFEWGWTDCGTTADRWCQIVLGFSPMQRFGRVVTDEASGREWISERGGLLRGSRDVLTRAGAQRVKGEPRAGNIGVVVVDNRACIAIYNGELWCSRDDDGFIVANDTYRLIAWEIETCLSR
ncbi:hypothetical protein G6M87_10930 [Rhizobium rhizogenes]|uniref:DUF6950 family protein n=1 Tax=Rhizobium rhizogenes TaxID=359 RepID=UPI001572BAF8|nr:hypothetical protein [Rhizobium rhizogenes]NTI22371.1 hypothetical protein [Rhizobium rhizogenes]QTG05957.1 hypothetical protein G6M87_10930 [Rhizobium rhizogenes]